MFNKKNENTVAAGFNKIFNISQLGTAQVKPKRLWIPFTDGGNKSSLTGKKLESPVLLLFCLNPCLIRVKKHLRRSKLQSAELYWLVCQWRAHTVNSHQTRYTIRHFYSKLTVFKLYINTKYMCSTTAIKTVNFAMITKWTKWDRKCVVYHKKINCVTGVVRAENDI